MSVTVAQIAEAAQLVNEIRMLKILVLNAESQPAGVQLMVSVIGAQGVQALIHSDLILNKLKDRIGFLGETLEEKFGVDILSHMDELEQQFSQLRTQNPS